MIEEKEINFDILRGEVAIEQGSELSMEKSNIFVFK